jgi:hypothetical protein
MPVDVTHFSRGGQGLSPAQLVRLEVLEKQRPLSGWEVGELRALAQVGSAAERRRALAAVERAMPTPKQPGQTPVDRKKSSGRGW